MLDHTLRKIEVYILLNYISIKQYNCVYKFSPACLTGTGIQMDEEVLHLKAFKSITTEGYFSKVFFFFFLSFFAPVF